MLGDVEAFGEKRLLEAHGLSVARGVWGAVLWGWAIDLRLWRIRHFNGCALRTVRFRSSDSMQRILGSRSDNSRVKHGSGISKRYVTSRE